MAAHAGARGDPRSEQPSSLHRLINFSDAVFAIAATLLFINLVPPRTSSEVYEQALLDYLSRPGPFLATTIGFLVVASFWNSHRRTIALLRDASPGLVRANLVLLFGVGAQPFLTAALAEHDPNRTSVILYSVGEIGTCLAQLALWAVALRHPELLTAAATPRRIRYVTIQLLRAPITFALSIPVTIVVGPAYGMASWAVMVVIAVAAEVWFADLRTQRPAVPRAA
jgi:uncharacterized membrane protein